MPARLEADGAKAFSALIFSEGSDFPKYETLRGTYCTKRISYCGINITMNSDVRLAFETVQEGRGFDSA